MIKPEELKDKNYKIFLGMPMYGGMLTENTMHGLLNLQQWCMARGVGMRVQSMGNESLITRARNTVVSMMMDATDYVATHLLFIDSDIGFDAQNIERLLCFDKEVVCGIYPRKHVHFEKIPQILKDNPNASPDELEVKSLGYNLNFDDPMNVKMESGFCKVNEAATGMMLVKREVFRTMFKKFPERKYQSDQIINGKSFSSDNCYDLFCAGIYETKPGVKRYLSEDYYFSRLWQECGGDIWADVSMPLTHFGNRAFEKAMLVVYLQGKMKVRILQHSSASLNSVYCFEDFLEDKTYLNYLSEKINEYTKIDEMQRSTNVRASMTSYFKLLEDSEFNLIHQKILQTLNMIWTFRSPTDNEIKITMTNSWGMKHRKGDFTYPHIHNIAFSGAFYLKTPGSDFLWFEEYNKLLPLKENMLVLFPGLTKHSAFEHTHEEARLSMAFNISLAD